jgi:hypothetical protein
MEIIYIAAGHGSFGFASPSPPPPFLFRFGFLARFFVQILLREFAHKIFLFSLLENYQKRHGSLRSPKRQN